MSKNIVVLTKKLSRNTGGFASILDVIETLNNLGYNVNVILPSYSLLHFFVDSKFINKKFKSSLHFNNIITVPNSWLNLFTIYKSNNNSLIKILNNIILFIFGLLSKKRFYQTLKDADIIITAIPLSSGAKEIFKSLSSAKLMLNHAGSVESFSQYWLNEDHKPNNYDNSKTLYVNYCKQFDKILFQAEDQAQECRQQDRMLEGLPVVIKPSCSEDQVLSSKTSESPYLDSNFNIVNIGSIQPRKGQDLSIEASINFLKRHKNAELHFVGRVLDKRFYKSLLDFIEEEQLENKVKFYGHRNDYIRFLSHADCLIQTSKAEGVSRILRESMLLKIPIISFAISGTISVLENDVDSLLIEPFKTKKLDKAIERIYNDRMLAERLTKAAFKKYLLEYSHAIYASRWNNFINSV